MLINSPAHLATVVRDAREQQKLSQDQVSQRVGLKQATISTFENHPDGTKLDTLFRILSAVDLELHVVLKNSSQSHPNTNNDTNEW